MAKLQDGEWGPLTVIEWTDACAVGGGGWNPVETLTALKSPLIRSTGWVLKETKKEVVLVSSASDSGLCGGDICIPKIAIKHRWTLRHPPVRGSK